jgi:hypothetical protein
VVDHHFRSQLDHIDKLSQELNEYQRVFKMPLTNLEVLTILKVEFENLEEIYRVTVFVIFFLFC